ncbi:collagen, type I, alpha 1a-like [Camelus dromedarius]|uniref:collagen, type I, alpha 1a-like n=1 Tax=Camelus dromedarius TaxID=9838 RepID=UPI0031193608
MGPEMEVREVRTCSQLHPERAISQRADTWGNRPNSPTCALRTTLGGQRSGALDLGAVGQPGEEGDVEGKGRQNMETSQASPATSPGTSALEGEDAQRPVGLVAGVLGHALAPEVVGEDAPVQRGAGPHVGVVHDRPHVVVHELAPQGAAVAQAARPGQQRRGPGRRESAAPPPGGRAVPAAASGAACHHHRAAAAAAAALASPGRLASSPAGAPAARGGCPEVGSGMVGGGCARRRRPALRRRLRRGVGPAADKQQSPHLPGPSPPPPPHCACPARARRHPPPQLPGPAPPSPRSPHPPPAPRLLCAQPAGAAAPGGHYPRAGGAGSRGGAARSGGEGAPGVPPAVPKMLSDPQIPPAGPGVLPGGHLPALSQDRLSRCAARTSARPPGARRGCRCREVPGLSSTPDDGGGGARGHALPSGSALASRCVAVAASAVPFPSLCPHRPASHGCALGGRGSRRSGAAEAPLRKPREGPPTWGLPGRPARGWFRGATGCFPFPPIALRALRRSHSSRGTGVPVGAAHSSTRAPSPSWQPAHRLQKARSSSGPLTEELGVATSPLPPEARSSGFPASPQAPWSSMRSSAGLLIRVSGTAERRLAQHGMTGGVAH